MYKITFKHFCIEMACVLLSLYLCAAGVYFGWYGMDLRQGWMLAWAGLVVLPMSLAPYFLAQVYLVPSPFNRIGRIA